MPPAPTVQDGEPLNDAEQAQLDQIQQNFDTDGQESSLPRLHRFNGPITYALVGESEQSIDNHARMEGDKQHTADLNKEGNVARRVIRNLWKGTLFGGYYGEKRYRDKKEEIIESNNSFVHSIDENAMGATRRATLKRFIKAEQEYRHSDETRHVLDADSEFATGIKSLVREYVQEGLDDETLQQKRQEFLDTYRENNGTDEIGEGLVEMDNLVAIAKNVKAMVEQEQSIDFVLDNMQFVVGEANTGTRTEAKYDFAN